MNVGVPELLIVLGIILLLFGATRLPKLAKSLGQASSEFKKGMSEGAKDDDEVGPAAKAGDKAGAKAEDRAAEKVTMTRAELDALLAEREARARRDEPPAT